MTKAALTVGLLGAAALSGTALGLGVGRPPRPENPGVAALREQARDPGRALFTERKCVNCHGLEGGGTDMGPGLGAVVAEYLADARGDEDAAKERLVRYMKEPQKVPILRRDTTRYPNPMPSAQGLGLTDADLAQVAEFLVHMKTPGVAVGGDASGR